jgi:hypothetical protein
VSDLESHLKLLLKSHLTRDDGSGNVIVNWDSAIAELTKHVANAAASTGFVVNEKGMAEVDGPKLPSGFGPKAGSWVEVGAGTMARIKEEAAKNAMEKAWRTEMEQIKLQHDAMKKSVLKELGTK